MENNEIKNEIKFDFSGMRAENFENEKYGISYKDIMKISQDVDIAYYNVMDNESKETESYFNLVRAPQEVEEIKEYAKYIAENFENFVVLGIGGSALGARALFSALTKMDYKKCDDCRGKRPRWFVRDSISPEKFACLLNTIDATKTMFCVVTKSGGTLETLLQLNFVVAKLQETLGQDFSKNICAITANKEGKLNKWAQENNVKTFYFDGNVSGRFSVFSVVGLLPAAVVGADIEALLDGANKMLERCHSLKFFENPALYGAALQKIAMDRGCNVSYLMPYSDNLKIVAEWYCQLCAESLGKSIKKCLKTKYVGLTPVKALGTVDQHSQMQLCLEGPYDKVVTFIKVNRHDSDIEIKDVGTGLLDDYIYGNTLTDIVNTSQKATAKALLERDRFNRTIEIEEVNENTMGQLLMFFMIETSFMGALLNINTYDQPSVELIKTNIKDFLNENTKCECECCCECCCQDEAICEEIKDEDEKSLDEFLSEDKDEQTNQVEENVQEQDLSETQEVETEAKDEEIAKEIQVEENKAEESESVKEEALETQEAKEVQNELQETETKETTEQEQIVMPEVEEIEKVEEPVFEEKVEFQEENNFGFLQEEMNIEEPKQENEESTQDEIKE